jgi:hypothetical protein
VNKQELLAIIADIKFASWEFVVTDKGDGWNLQVQFYAPDIDNLDLPDTLQKGRKWYISSYATRQEVVRTAFKACLTAIEHEACEQFKYKGVAIHNPHIDPDELVNVGNNRVYRG